MTVCSLMEVREAYCLSQNSHVNSLLPSFDSRCPTRCTLLMWCVRVSSFENVFSHKWQLNHSFLILFACTMDRWFCISIFPFTATPHSSHRVCLSSSACSCMCLSNADFLWNVLLHSSHNHNFLPASSSSSSFMSITLPSINLISSPAIVLSSITTSAFISLTSSGSTAASSL